MDQPLITIRRVGAWSCFLGSSWTWVIGMLFPILLLRDYGPWGWIVFAVPNVLGAMAMGLVLHRQGLAQRILDRHKVACGVFSNFTFVFHVLVLCWVSAALLGWVSVVIILILVPAARLLNIGSIFKKRRILITGIIVTLVSWWLFYLGSGKPTAWQGVAWDAPTRLTSTELLWFIPAAVMGFGLCPYLDRTFYRARISLSGRAGSLAFVLGFGVVFLSMILFALMYSGVARPIFEFQLRNMVNDAIPASWLAPLCAFVLVQAVFTMVLHEDHGEQRPPRREIWGTLGIAAAALGGVLILRYRLMPESWLGGLTPFEVGYRVFLLAYGVLFPAYVWLCMLPTLRGSVAIHKSGWVALVAAFVALPMAYASFVLATGVWVLGVLLVMLVARGYVEWLGIQSEKQKAVV